MMYDRPHSPQLRERRQRKYLQHHHQCRLKGPMLDFPNNIKNLLCHQKGPAVRFSQPHHYGL